MSINVFDIQHDKVISSNYIVAKTSYDFALENLVPLIDRLDQQRNTLPPQFYLKLEKDLKNGCIMPPLTIALIDTNYSESDTLEQTESFINENINSAFILDGIQRLNTLRRIGKDSLDLSRPLYLNILICNSMDKLLYRMITLNNGQKPMSARHQVEILAGNIYNFDDISLNVQTEKEKGKKKIKGAFKKGDIIKAYLAFISNSINIDNQKIIEEKLDELITDKIIESDVTERSIEFSDVIDLIEKFTTDSELAEWFLVANNLIGFSAGISASFESLKHESLENFKGYLGKVEDSLSNLEVSKIKLGLARRISVQYIIQNYSHVKDLSSSQITDMISMKI